MSAPTRIAERASMYPVGTMKRFTLTLCAAFAGALSGCSDDVERVPGAPPPALEEGCDATVAESLAAWEVAGFDGAVAIVGRDETVCLRGVGEADRSTGARNGADTVFSIGSVSKLFTAVAVLELESDGVLSLDDRVSNFLEPWPRDKAEISVRDLLVHTSGLGNSHGPDHEPLTRERALAAIAQQELLFAPGEGYDYSNSGYTLLAMVIEAAAGVPFRDFLSKRVLTLPSGRVAGGFWDGEPAPNGPRAIGYLAPDETGFPGRSGDDNWALDGNGSQAMSVSDLAIWLLALSRGEILDQSRLDVLTTPLVDLGDGLGEAPGWVAADESLLGARALTASGGGGDVGHEAALIWFPELALIAAVVSNSPEVLAGELLEQVARALVAGQPISPPRAVKDLPPEVLTPLEGSYALEPDGTLAVQRDGGGLRITAEGEAALGALYPLPDGVGGGRAEAHQAAASAFFGGETAEARAELTELERELGALLDVTLEGTILDDGELRTYATLTFEAETLLVWIALSELGSLSALEIGADWPSLRLGAVDDELTFVPRSAPRNAPPIEVSFDADGAMLVVSGPDGEFPATRVARP